MASTNLLRTPVDSGSVRRVVNNASLPESLATGIIAISFLLAFFWFRNNYTSFFYVRGEYSVFITGLALAIALIFFRIKYSIFPRAYSSYTRVTAVGILVFLLIEPPDFTLANPQYGALNSYVEVGHWIALATGFLSLWRPSFLFPTALFTLSARFAATHIAGFSVSILDIQYMMEIGQFLALSSCGIAVLKLLQTNIGDSRVGILLRRLDTNNLSTTLVFVAFGLHLGNYFWSGYAKLIMGPEVWSWIFENKTENLIPQALMRGALPTGPWPGLTQWLFDSFSSVTVPVNAFIVVVQLFALFAVLRLNWLRLVTLLYDAFHIGIYVFGGLFFWPWIWNNASILLAVRGYSDEEIGWLPKACCAIAILLGGSHMLGDSARLAWFDLVDIKIPIIQAETPDKQWVDVPPSYFLGHSYLFSHGNIDLSPVEGHYPPTQWGIGLNYDQAVTTGKCIAPPPVTNPETETEHTARIAQLGRLLRAHHRKILQRVDTEGHYSPYFRSHHHPSNPWLFEEFNRLDLRQVHNYRLLTQSVCLKLEKGILLKHEVKRDEVVFNVD